MREIAEFIVTLFELLQTEMNRVRRGVSSVLNNFLFMIAGMMIFLGGLALLLYGAYLLLLYVVSPIGAVFIIAGVTLVLGYIVMSSAARQ
ncbi:MAG: hypothetical protein GF404_01020 [candidate division Zixibacteria bacterium]|jgi:uncharacterized membrane protein YgdD (TMEM256/DUF423 family)|nr:hypothetical protein [candidate division Zixibacteria bacterium]